MKLWVNGELQEVPNGITVAELLGRLAVARERVAVEVNEQVVRKAQHAAHRLEPEDRVEVVTFVGGG